MTTVNPYKQLDMLNKTISCINIDLSVYMYPSCPAVSLDATNWRKDCAMDKNKHVFIQWHVEIHCGHVIKHGPQPFIQ
jgi:hypothetical protein